MSVLVIIPILTLIDIIKANNVVFKNCVKYKKKYAGPWTINIFEVMSGRVQVTVVDNRESSAFDVDYIYQLVFVGKDRYSGCQSTIESTSLEVTAFLYLLREARYGSIS